MVIHNQSQVLLASNLPQQQKRDERLDARQRELLEALEGSEIRRLVWIFCECACKSVFGEDSVSKVGSDALEQLLGSGCTSAVARWRNRSTIYVESASSI